MLCSRDMSQRLASNMLSLATLLGLGCGPDPLAETAPASQPLVFIDDTGLHAVWPPPLGSGEEARAVRLAPPALPSARSGATLPPSAWLSPSGRRVVQIGNLTDYTVFEITGAELGRFSLDGGTFVDWLDEETLLVREDALIFARIDLRGRRLTPLTLPAETTSWGVASLMVSPDHSRLALTQMPLPWLPAPLGTEVLVLATDGTVVQRMTGPELSAWVWTREGELLVISNTRYARASSPDSFRDLPFAPCGTQPWLPGLILSRKVGAGPGGVVGCYGMWEIGIEDGVSTSHWQAGAAALSPDATMEVFSREGALWAASPDGESPRLLVRFTGVLQALDW
jgi:hypothetical protein